MVGRGCAVPRIARLPPAAAHLELHGATRSYGAARALDGVDLAIARGEMVALIGPSGSGKSTLLRALVGLVRLDRVRGGRIVSAGDLVQEDGRLGRDVRRVRRRTGFVFQDFNLVGRLTLFANVMIGALGRTPGWRGVLGLWPAADRAAAMQALARVGLAERAGQRASLLSGGQQQRGAIARTLLQRAEAVLADEPVASLDPASARAVMETLRALNTGEGLTVLVTLHQVDYALRYCDRVVGLNAGRVVFDGPPSALDAARLKAIYGVEMDAALAPAALAVGDAV